MTRFARGLSILTALAFLVQVTSRPAAAATATRRLAPVPVAVAAAGIAHGVRPGVQQDRGASTRQGRGADGSSGAVAPLPWSAPLVRAARHGCVGEPSRDCGSAIDRCGFFATAPPALG